MNDQKKYMKVVHPLCRLQITYIVATGERHQIENQKA